MKLLLDENLSRRLLPALQSSFPGSTHVADIGLQGHSDHDIWSLARRQDFVLVSKDDDFRQLSLLRGAPPKVVVLAIGNGGNEVVLDLLLSRRERIEAFTIDPVESYLVLHRAPT